MENKNLIKGGENGLDVKSKNVELLKIFELDEILRLSGEVEEKQKRLRERFAKFLQVWSIATEKKLRNENLERIEICDIEIEDGWFVYYLKRGSCNVFKLQGDNWKSDDFVSEIEVTSERMDIVRMRKFVRNLQDGLKQYIERLKKESEDFDKVNELLKRFE